MTSAAVLLPVKVLSIAAAPGIWAGTVVSTTAPEPPNLPILLAARGL